MRVSALLLVLILTSGFYTCSRAQHDAVATVIPSASTREPAPATTPSTAQTKIDFATQVRPLLESRCTPCHFAGGTMYQRLPFDRPETLHALGTKLFTRIKDEKEQRLLRDFLSQLAEQDHALP
jgi:hypothetical protein